MAMSSSKSETILAICEVDDITNGAEDFIIDLIDFNVERNRKIHQEYFSDEFTYDDSTDFYFMMIDKITRDFRNKHLSKKEFQGCTA